MLLEVAKLLFQKDTRDSLKELVALIKKEPEWRANLLDFDETFPQAERRKAELLVRFLHEVLLQKGWKAQRAGVAEFVVQEIVDNAFQHGTDSDGSSGKVRIRAALTNYWITCQVTDSGKGFDLHNALSAQATEGGHGLSKVKALAISLTQENPNSIKVTVENHAGKIDLADIDGVFILNLKGRLTHESVDYNREAASIDEALPDGSKVIIDLTETQYASSVALRFLMMLQKRNEAHHRKTVLVVPKDSVIREIFEVAGFDSVFQCVALRAEALELFQVPQ